MQIPTFGESQVLQPGNPVPIGNADSTMADSMAYLGKALVGLGDAMDKEEKVKKSRIGEYQVQAALEDFEMQKRIYNQKLIKDQASRKDITGVDALKQSGEYGADLATQMSTLYGFSPEQQAMFTAGTKKIRNNLDPELMVASSKATEEDYKSAVETTLNITTGKIFQEPALTDQYLAQVENDTIDDFDKGLVLNLDKALAERRAQVIMGAVNRFKTNNNFDEAEGFLTKYATMYSNEDRDKYIKEIRAAKSQFLNDENTAGITKQREEEKRIDKMHMDNGGLLLAKVEAAGGMGSFALARTRKEITVALLNGEISPEMGKSLLTYEPSTTKDLTDPAFTGKILEKAFRTGNFMAAQKELNKAMKAQSISSSTYVETTKEIGKYLMYQQNRNSDKSWDTAKMALNTTLDYYKSIGKDPGSLDSVQSGKMYQVLMQVLSETDRMQKSGGTVDFGAIRNNIPSKFGSEYNLPAPTVSNGVQIKGLDGIEKEMKNSMKRVKDKSTPTSEKQKELENIKRLQGMRTNLLKEGAGRGTNDRSGNTGTRNNATNRTN